MLTRASSRDTRPKGARRSRRAACRPEYALQHDLAKLRLFVDGLIVAAHCIEHAPAHSAGRIGDLFGPGERAVVSCKPLQDLEAGLRRDVPIHLVPFILSR